MTPDQAQAHTSSNSILTSAPSCNIQALALTVLQFYLRQERARPRCTAYREPGAIAILVSSARLNYEASNLRTRGQSFHRSIYGFFVQALIICLDRYESRTPVLLRRVGDLPPVFDIISAGYSQHQQIRILNKAGEVRGTELASNVQSEHLLSASRATRAINDRQIWVCSERDSSSEKRAGIATAGQQGCCDLSWAWPHCRLHSHAATGWTPFLQSRKTP